MAISCKYCTEEGKCKKADEDALNFDIEHLPSNVDMTGYCMEDDVTFCDTFEEAE